MKKKSFALLVVSLFLLSFFSFSTLAASSDTLDIGGYRVRVITDFENFEDGLLNGDVEDDALTGTVQNGLLFGIRNGFGVNGSKAYVLGAEDDPSLASGVFTEASYKPQLDEKANLNLEGATDFVFWIDTTGETLSVAFQIVIGERDYDADGEPVMKENMDTGALEYQITWRNIWDGIDTKYYTLADGETEWVEHTGTSGYYVRLDNTFKGYVRIPLDTFELCWGSQDVNDTFDFKYLTDIGFYYGMYSRHAETGYAIALDNIGFAGDFKKDISKLTVDPIPDQTATGSEVKPAVVVRDGDKVLQEGVDYTITYSDNINAGTAKVTITGKGDYSGTKIVEFKIVNANNGPTTPDPAPTNNDGKAPNTTQKPINNVETGVTSYVFVFLALLIVSSITLCFFKRPIVAEK